MVAQTMQICLIAISSVFDIMGYVFEQLGAWTWILGAITLYTIFRLLIVPVIGAAVSSGASDTVKKIKGSNKSGSSKSSSNKKNGGK